MIAPMTAVMIRWLPIAPLSAMSSPSMSRSAAIATTRFTALSGARTRSGRASSRIRAKARERAYAAADAAFASDEGEPLARRVRPPEADFSRLD